MPARVPSHAPPRAARRSAPVLAGLALLFFAACGESSVIDPYRDAAGVFLLQSIAGDELPAVITSTPTDGEIQVTTGSLFLSSDRRFQETLTLRMEPPDAPARTGTAVASGTYTLVGDSLEFSIDARGSTPASKMQARLRGDTLSYTAAGRVVVYRKL